MRFTNLGKNKQTTFYCFSPPVMLATFIIEIGLLIYVVFKFKRSLSLKLVGGILVLLSIFQLSEFNICGVDNFLPGVWARIGFVAITFLPPFGLHLAHALSGRKANLLVWFAYLTAFLWAGAYLFIGGMIDSHICGGNYVIFELGREVSSFYSVYYYLWLLAGIWASMTFSKRAAGSKRQALYALAIGYAAFLVPTAVVYSISPSAISGIPSIMCGFAVIFALILAFKVAPSADTVELISKYDNYWVDV